MPPETGMVRGKAVQISHGLTGVMTKSRAADILTRLPLRGLHAKVGIPPGRKSEVACRGRNRVEVPRGQSDPITYVRAEVPLKGASQ